MCNTPLRKNIQINAFYFHSLADHGKYCQYNPHDRQLNKA